jgi:spermidine/putrescine transport system ATP-binding protein
MFEGKVIERTDDHIEVETVFGRLQVSGSATPGTTVHISIRPEQIKAEEGGTQQLVALGKLNVEEVAFFGTHHRCQGRHAISNQPLIIRLPQNQPAAAGEQIAIAVQRDDIVLLTR